MAFSVTTAAVEGFRVLGRNPVAAAVWALLLIVLCAAFGGLAFWLFADNFELIAATDNIDESEALAFLGKLGGLLAFAVVVFSLVSAVFYAAVVRAALGRREGVAYLKLGMDELRLVGVFLVVSIAAYAFCGAVVGLIVLLALSDVVLGLRIAGGILLGLAGVATLIWVGVRLSLLFPATVAEGRIDIGRAWAMTRGRFWPLVGLTLLVFVMLFVMQILVQIVQAALHLAPAAVIDEVEDLSGLIELATANAPLLALAALVFAVYQIVYMTISWAPYARAYRDIAATQGEEAA